MSNPTIARASKAADRERAAERRSSRAMKFAGQAFDVHGYIVVDYTAATWNECVEEARRLQARNSTIAVVDLWEL